MSTKSKTIRFALIQTIPILCSYLFMGIAFGILFQQVGYNFIWAAFASVTNYAGSFQFVLPEFLDKGASVITIALTCIFMNSRHIFYGLSFVDAFKRTGKCYPYMIFSLTDETYSIFCSAKYPNDIDVPKAMFIIAFLNQLYWIAGSVIGALAGQLIPFDFKGIDFAMTAFFATVFINQWRSFSSHLPAIIGIISGVLCLILLGPDNFILPALISTVILLYAFKGRVEKTEKEMEESL